MSPFEALVLTIITIISVCVCVCINKEQNDTTCSEIILPVEEGNLTLSFTWIASPHSLSKTFWRILKHFNLFHISFLSFCFSRWSSETMCLQLRLSNKIDMHYQSHASIQLNSVEILKQLLQIWNLKLLQ